MDGHSRGVLPARFDEWPGGAARRSIGVVSPAPIMPQDEKLKNCFNLYRSPGWQAGLRGGVKGDLFTKAKWNRCKYLRRFNPRRILPAVRPTSILDSDY
jgi:hypothetical protein